MAARKNASALDQTAQHCSDCGIPSFNRCNNLMLRQTALTASNSPRPLGPTFWLLPDPLRAAMDLFSSLLKIWAPLLLPLSPPPPGSTPPLCAWPAEAAAAAAASAERAPWSPMDVLWASRARRALREAWMGPGAEEARRHSWLVLLASLWAAEALGSAPA